MLIEELMTKDKEKHEIYSSYEDQIDDLKRNLVEANNHLVRVRDEIELI